MYLLTLTQQELYHLALLKGCVEGEAIGLLDDLSLVLVGKDLSCLLCGNLDIKLLGNSHLSELLALAKLKIDAV